jgi:hypothetical protein
MPLELRPGSDEAFRERLRTAEIRRQNDLEKVERKPRAVDKKKLAAKRRIESILDAKKFEAELLEVWETAWARNGPISHRLRLPLLSRLLLHIPPLHPLAA